MKAAQGKNTVNEMVEHFTGWILEGGGRSAWEDA